MYPDRFQRLAWRLWPGWERQASINRVVLMACRCASRYSRALRCEHPIEARLIWQRRSSSGELQRTDQSLSLLVLRSVSLNLSFSHILRIALRLRASRTAVCTSAAARTSVAGSVERTSTGVPCGVVGVAAVLDDPINNLLFGKRLSKAE
jgi:hypothetical protein